MWGLSLLSAADVGFTTLKRRIHLLRCEEILQKLWYKGLGLMSWQPGLGGLLWASYDLVGYGFDNDWMQKERD